MLGGRVGVLEYIRALGASEAHRRLSQLSDQELLRRFSAERDEGAFAVLVHRHGRMVFCACRRALRNREDAEEAFQAAFLLLAKKAGAQVWQKSVANWLYLVALRLARQARAKVARRAGHEGRVQAVASGDTAAEAAGRELRTVCDEELARLPERCRLPIVLCCLEGLTRDEAAEQLGWPLGTLKRRLEQGRELLRARLAGRGYTLSAALFTTLLAQGSARAALPPGLAGSTVEAAAAFAAGRPATSLAVSIHTAELTNGVLKAMFWTKVRSVLVVTLAACVLALGALGATRPTPAWGDEPPGKAGPKGAKAATPADKPAEGKDTRKELEELVKKEQERLAGTWAQESFTGNGVTTTEGEPGFSVQRRTFKGNRWVERYEGTLDAPDDPRLPEIEFTLDPSKSPGWIDYRPVNRPEKWVGVGIYKLEGDTLTICFRVEAPAPDKKADRDGVGANKDAPVEKVKRPEAFEAKKGQQTGLAVFKRVKK